MKIPFFGKKKKKSKYRLHRNDELDQQFILNSETPFAVQEAYRSVCTNIMYLPLHDRCRKIVITSAVPGEGKSIFSVNLAATMACDLGGKRVLLIDADIRKPRTMRLLTNPEKPSGLSEFLAGIDDTPNIVSSERFEGLSILYSGKSTPNPTGLISSDRMDELMKYCDENFDYVFIDSPPVNMISDAILLKKHVDGYLVIAKSGYSDLKNLNFAIDSLQRMDAKVFGIVLTAVDPKSPGVSRYGYTYY